LQFAAQRTADSLHFSLSQNRCEVYLVLPEHERRVRMSLIQGGPPQWIWERTPDPLKWDIIPSRSPQGNVVYELRVSCGLEIMRLQFFTEDELKELPARIADGLSSQLEPMRNDGKSEGASTVDPAVTTCKANEGRQKEERLKPALCGSGGSTATEAGVFSDPDFSIN